MVYVGYLQNMLARMRTMVLSIAGIFAAIALSVAFYPYTPRPTIALALMVLLLGIGVVVSHVCAGLDRDSTLSHITNTEPGALGGHFWLRIISFLGVPALGLVVAQFPEITDLSAVRATDARAASVTTADGRTFGTTDGGSTWIRP